jgi:hypothetical protein
MNPIVNLNIVLEKELELERQGMRRTRRWIGDASQVTDARWYQTKLSRFSGIKHNLEEVSRVAETKPRREAPSSILNRLFNLPSTSRQPAGSES